MTGAKLFQEIDRTDALNKEPGYIKVDMPGHGATNTQQRRLQMEVQFFSLPEDKFQKWEQHFAGVIKFTKDCGAYTFKKIIEHYDGLPMLGAKPKQLAALCITSGGGSASILAENCRNMHSLIVTVGKLDIAALGLLS